MLNVLLAEKPPRTQSEVFPQLMIHEAEVVLSSFKNLQLTLSYMFAK